ncbi:MAG: glycine betaine ABC transporter substrate-binding protein [Syntrophomonas sp.]|nr:glycine betaine ABC transporter substrate-binding protein [Syntrophomonas sp.]
MHRSRKLFIILTALLLFIGSLSWFFLFRNKNDGEDTKLLTYVVFADAEWESIKAHNRIAGYIIEHGYGYKPVYLAGETLPLFDALSRGDIDVMMEIWTPDYLEQWTQMIKSTQVKDLGSNFNAIQGWYVPAYMVEGDVERGIEPQLPFLKSVQDLSLYHEKFRLSPTTNNGVIYNAPNGWPAETINQEKFAAYHLANNFMLLAGVSELSLQESLDKAYASGSAWLGYAREPSIINAGHKMLLLREEPYNEEQWRQTRTCAYPEITVRKAANSAMNQKSPELLDFLMNYKTTWNQNEEILLQVIKFNADKEKAAEEWLRNNPDVWKQWVPDDVAKKIWNSLNPAPKKNSFFSRFKSS